MFPMVFGLSKHLSYSPSLNALICLSFHDNIQINLTHCPLLNIPFQLSAFLVFLHSIYTHISEHFQQNLKQAIFNTGTQIFKLWLFH